MNKDNVKKWVEALRSGKYEQTTSSLYDNGRYCCLGVLCEVAGIERSGSAYEDQEQFLPESACRWIGMGDDHFGDDPLIGEHFATSWNDTHGKTFPEIADLIEKYWLNGVER